MSNLDIAFGTKVRDIVTGFEGIVTGRTDWMNGCTQYIVKPPLDKDGKSQDAHWVDWQQLEVVDAGVSAAVAEQRAAAPERSGGPSPFAKLPSRSN